MKNILYIFLVVFLFQPYNLLVSKEAKNHMCYKRGYEIIFPYQEAVFKLKEKLNISADQKREELNKFKDHFERNFRGIPLYKEAGCSNARLSEYLECLISTDGKDCKIYYTQMRIVD